jgi:hypothetical protein
LAIILLWSKSKRTYYWTATGALSTPDSDLWGCSELHLNRTFFSGNDTPQGSQWESWQTCSKPTNRSRNTASHIFPSATVSHPRSPPAGKIGSLLTIVISRIRLEGAEGLNFRVASFIAACKAGHFSWVINPFVFVNSQKESRSDTGYLVQIFSPLSLLIPPPLNLIHFSGLFHSLRENNLAPQ